MSVKYRRLSNSGDYTFGAGQYDFCSDSEAVGQAIKTKLLLLKGEWWENIENGTQLFEQMLSKPLSDFGKNAVDIVIKNRVLEVEGVSSIIEFNSYVNREARSYTAELIIDTIYGNVNTSFTFGG